MQMVNLSFSKGTLMLPLLKLKVSAYNKNNNTKQRGAEKKFRSCTVKLSVKLLGVKFTRRGEKRLFPADSEL